MPRRLGHKVEVFAEGVTPPRGTRAWLARYATGLLDALPLRSPAGMTVTLVDDATIRQLNRQHLGHDYATDVLSFPDDEEFPRPGARRAPLGEVIIGLGVAERQAQEAGHGLRAELAHLIVHGLLHLRGYEHDTPEATSGMEQAERELVTAALETLGEADRAGVTVPHAG